MTVPSFLGWRRRLAVAAVLVALLQSAVLFYMVESRAAILRHGTPVLLETAPVDPRDLLRGDYVTLNYTISRVPADKVIAWPARRGRYPLSVRLTPGENGYWEVAEASFGPLAPQQGSVVLAGEARFHGSDHALSVSYGIERYYVPEGEGREIEEMRDGGRISVSASVSGGGAAQIRALLMDGTPLYEEPLY